MMSKLNLPNPVKFLAMIFTVFLLIMIHVTKFTDTIEKIEPGQEINLVGLDLGVIPVICAAILALFIFLILATPFASLDKEPIILWCS